MRKSHTRLISCIFFLVCLLSRGARAQDRVPLPTVPEKPSENIEDYMPKAGRAIPTLPGVPERPSESIEQYMPRSPVVQVSFPPYQPAEQWVLVNKFEGGLNEFFPASQLPPNQAQTLINFLPYGGYWLKKREGYQKIDTVTAKGTVWGLAVGDSANVASRLVVAGTDTIYYTYNLYNGTFYQLGTTTSEPTFFTSTPFGLVISNDGSDATRLWDGSASSGLENLGSCDTATISDTAGIDEGSDTLQLITNNYTWAHDQWIGYYVECGAGGATRYKIIDNDSNSIYAVGAKCDTCVADSSVEIFAQPDSTSSGLTYPKGRATAYYQDRLFVASHYYPWRIWYSNPRLINEIDPESFINLDMDAQDEIQAMRVFNGNLIVLGSNSMYGINSSLEVTPITKALGCSAPKSVAIGDDYIYFLSQPTAVYRFNGNIYGSMSYKLEPISDLIRSSLASVDVSVLDNAAGVYTDKQYWLAYSPDTCLVFDERTKQWYKQGFGFTEALSLLSDFRNQSSEIIYPTSDVTSDWASTGGTDYEVIDDQTNDDDYIYTASHNQVNEQGMGDLSNYPTGGIIQNITISVRAAKVGVGSAKAFVYLDLVLPQAETDSVFRVGTIDVSGGFQNHTFVLEQNPFYDIDWASTTVDSLQARFTSDNNASINIGISGMWIEPSYRSDIPTSDFLFATTHKDYIYKYGGILTDDTSGTVDGYVVSGEAATAIYHSGWFHTDLPINQYQMKGLWIDKLADGNVTTYLYTNRSSTATDTVTYSSTSDAAELEWLEPQIAGHDFSIKIETSADSCFLKGWGALLRNLGERKD